MKTNTSVSAFEQTLCFPQKALDIRKVFHPKGGPQFLGLQPSKLTKQVLPKHGPFRGRHLDRFTEIVLPGSRLRWCFLIRVEMFFLLRMEYLFWLRAGKHCRFLAKRVVSESFPSRFASIMFLKAMEDQWRFCLIGGNLRDEKRGPGITGSVGPKNVGTLTINLLATGKDAENDPPSKQPENPSRGGVAEELTLNFDGFFVPQKWTPKPPNTRRIAPPRRASSTRGSQATGGV